MPKKGPWNAQEVAEKYQRSAKEVPKKSPRSPQEVPESPRRRKKGREGDLKNKFHGEGTTYTQTNSATTRSTDFAQSAESVRGDLSSQSFNITLNIRLNIQTVILSILILILIAKTYSCSSLVLWCKLVEYMTIKFMATRILIFLDFLQFLNAKLCNNHDRVV